MSELDKLCNEVKRAVEHCEREAIHMSYEDLLRIFAGQMNLAFGKYCEAMMPQMVKKEVLGDAES